MYVCMYVVSMYVYHFVVPLLALFVFVMDCNRTVDWRLPRYSSFILRAGDLSVFEFGHAPLHACPENYIDRKEFKIETRSIQIHTYSTYMHIDV